MKVIDIILILDLLSLLPNVLSQIRVQNRKERLLVELQISIPFVLQNLYLDLYRLLYQCNIEKRLHKNILFLITSSNLISLISSHLIMTCQSDNCSIWRKDCIFTTCRGGYDCALLSMNNVCAARNACSYQENPSIL